MSSALLFIFNIVICDSIEIKIVFNCHSTLNFSKKKFIDYLGYFMGEVAAILNFAKLYKSSGKFTLAQRMDLFYYVLLKHFAKFWRI